MEDHRYTGLLNFCASITSNTLVNFKQNGNIQEIIENVSEHFGHQWLDNIKNTNINLTPDIILNILQLDHIGSPNKTRFNLNNTSILLSPTTVRFISITLDILNHIKSLSLNNLDIIEIGGGYGAQLAFLALLSPLYNITINSYTILDIPQVNNLQNIYLDKVKTYIKLPEYSCITLDDYKQQSNTNSLLISNYALGEFNKSWQDRYIYLVLSYIKHGYLVWNFSPETPNIHEYFQDKDINIRDEDPQGNCPPVKTKIITY